MNGEKRKINKNPDIQLLIQPVTKDEYSALEENIFDNGCHEPITIWNNTITTITQTESRFAQENNVNEDYLSP